MKQTRLLFLVFSFFIILPNSTSAKELVDSTQTYTYEIMVQDILELHKRFPKLIKYESIGKTVYGRDIWAVKLGKGNNTIFINGSHHAREWMTTMINMKMIEEYAEAYESNSLIGKFKAKDILEDSAIWFVPMVNPDGVTLQQKGLSAFPQSVHASLIKMNGGSKDFIRWKANAQGIDINRNYPANWERGTGSPDPFWWNYNGAKPFQSNESQALRDFTFRIKPLIAVSYHASGQILYWHFHNKKEHMKRDKQLAKTFESKTGYTMMPESMAPSGKGYTDWFIQEFGLPAFTPEISPSVGNRHVPLSYFSAEWKKNREIGLWLLAESYEFHNKMKKIIPFDEKINLMENEQLYKAPSFVRGTKEALAPQTVQAIEQFQNWYHIRLNGENRWVHVPYTLSTFSERSFLDVPKNHWAKASIDYAKKKQWLNGKDIDLFDPAGTITRAEMAAVLVRVLNLSVTVPNKPSFADVQKDYWAYASIETAKHHGLLGGISGTQYKPGQGLSRAQLAVILARISTKNAAIGNSTSSSFRDVPTTHWAYREISLMKELGILGGVDETRFGVNQKTTRAELAAVLKRMAETYPEFLTRP